MPPNPMTSDLVRGRGGDLRHRHSDPQGRRWCGDRGRAGSALSAKPSNARDGRSHRKPGERLRRGPPHSLQKETNLPTPWFWTSGLQNYGRRSFCCFKPQSNGHLLLQPQETSAARHGGCHSRPRWNRWGFAHGRHSLRQVICYLEELANPGKAGCPGQRGPGCQSAKNTKIRKYSVTWGWKDHTQFTHKITRIQETV